MTKAWTETTVGEWCPLAYGKGLPERDRRGGSVPVFGSNGVVGWHDESAVNGAGIIIGRKGTVGSVILSTTPFWPIDTTFYVGEADHRDLRFTAALLQSLGLDQRNSHSAVPGLSRDDAHQLLIRVPSLDEQRRIALVLSALDECIESLDRAERLLLNYGLTQLEIAIEAGDSRSMRVDEVATFENRKRIPLSQMERDRRPGPYPYYGATAIFGYVDDYLFDGFRVLVGEDGSVIEDDGTPVLQLAQGKYWVNNHAHVLAGRAVSTEALWFLLRNLAVDPAVTGAVQPKLSMGRLAALEVLVPSEASPFFTVAKECIAQVLHRREQLRHMVEARDFLLPRLVSGELRVAAAEKLLEAAT